MSHTERLYLLKSFLDAVRCLTRQFLLEEFGISPATVKRDIAHLRDRMNAPVVFDRERAGWRLDRQAATIGTQYELPGLWLAADEIHALRSFAVDSVQALFNLVQLQKNLEVPRAFADYNIAVHEAGIPHSITLHRRVG